MWLVVPSADLSVVIASRYIYSQSHRGFDQADFTRFVKGPLKDAFTDDDDAELRSIVRDTSLDYAKSRKDRKTSSRRKRR